MGDGTEVEVGVGEIVVDTPFTDAFDNSFTIITLLPIRQITKPIDRIVLFMFISFDIL